MLKRLVLWLAKNCWVCGAPINGGEVCDACNKGPGIRV